MNKKAIVCLVIAIVAYSEMLVSWSYRTMAVSAVVCCVAIVGFFVFFDLSLRCEIEKLAVLLTTRLCQSRLARLLCLLVRRVTNYGKAKDKKTGGEP